MYDIRNRREAVKELQKLLLELSEDDPRLLRVAVDGDYSARTAEAVLTFQHHYGLAESGIADLVTWQALADAGLRRRALRRARTEADFPSALPLGIGAVGRPVLNLQAALAELGDAYPELPRIAVTGSYRDGTAYAISLLQRKYGLSETGITDEETWARVMRDANTRERISYELNR